MTPLRHGCTHIAEWLEAATNELTCVTLRRIIDEQNGRLFDFHQVIILRVNDAIDKYCAFKLTNVDTTVFVYSNS